MKGWRLLTALLLALPAPAAAQSWEDYDYENLQFRGLGMDVGMVWPTGSEPTLGVGVRADMGFVGPNVRVTPTIRFWSSTLRDEVVGRLADQIVRICERQPSAVCPTELDLGQVRRSDLELSADAQYVFDTGAAVAPYAGGGVGLHLLNGRGEFIDRTFVEDLLDSVAPGLNLLGGVNLPLGRSLELLTEARLALTSDVQYATLVLGGSWRLPSPPAAPAQPRRVRRLP